MNLVTNPEEMSAIIANGLYLDHHMYEAMARNTRGVARVAGWAGERLDRRFGSEMAIAVYRPTDSKPPVIAFGNTRIFDTSASESMVRQFEQLVADLHEDLFPMGIGYYRYCFNEGRLKNVIEQLVARYDSKVIVTGHSLGGTLAQITAVRLPELVEAAVTFQSPHTTRALVEHLYGHQSAAVSEDLQSRSYHYKVVGDELIQEAGELSSPGELVRLTYRPDQIEMPAAYHAHVKQVFEPFVPTRGSLRAIQAIVERTLVLMELDTIGRPSGEVQSAESALIEWLRSNAIMLHLGAASLLTESLDPLGFALVLLEEVIYCALWTMNVNDFRDAPDSHTSLTDGVPGIPVRSFITDDHLRRMRDEFARYIRHSQVVA